MNLTPIQPDELRLIWPDQVRPMVEAVCERTRARWLPEDVYGAVAHGVAGMWLWLDTDTNIVGFIVLQRTRTWGEDTCDVWCCYHKQQDRSSSVRDVWPWVKDMARQMGCSVIQIDGPRAYHKVLPDLELTGYTYEARV